MFRPKLSLRRPLAVVGAAIVGLTAAVAMQSPASAHYSVPKGTAICDTTTGEWVVTWTVESKVHFDSTHFALHHVAVTPQGTTVEGIPVTQERNKYPHSVNDKLTGTQRVAGDARQATLATKAKWNDGYREQEAQRSKVTFEGKCEKETVPSPEPTQSPEPTPEPTATPQEPTPVTTPTAAFASDCEGAVTVTLSNGADANTAVKLTVKAKDFNETYEIAPNSSKNDIVVPAGAGAITVTEGEKSVGEPYTWQKPENCVKPGEPTGGFESTCDELVFMIANPENGKAVTVTFTPNKGEAKTVTVEPGKTETVKFPAEEGLTVTPSGDGLDEVAPIAWEKPADCGGTGGGGALPVTGAAAGTIAGGAALLLIIGGVLFFIARRRKVTFTA
ncbi:LPXTG-motif cell wall anchor domain-containing protein [Micromonospora pattaloongensis]|uniref:LPXTG-motif cell wall anchor domain-containing protein n=1 Tax=Micromonospora pattaloongensis TaxID=405436 RepID=A0A1H3KTN7_9ACTN|nr:hypothetical protein [Micromonospora pattaloongensis]SDY55376.1 LPXTG-motif cell wall anchor domain-containing protein [Micromonospora pattaloongensis]